MRTRKDIFLFNLLGKGRHKYRRYTGLPLRYAGGKSLGVGYIVEQIPSRIKKIVSPFFGGGSVEIACAKELGLEVKGYDIFDILTNYWEQQINNPVKLANKIMMLKPNKKIYEKVKAKLKAHWNKERAITNKLNLAAYYWFNHNLSYGPGFLGWMGKINSDEGRFTRLVGKVENFQCEKLTVACSSFDDTIPKHSGDFLYCDPPYYLGDDSKVFRGIYPQRNFPVHHNNFPHEKLRDLLCRHKGGFILSYNDCAMIRKWYSKFKIVGVAWQYTLGQGERRIGKNRIDSETKSHLKNSCELLIVS